MNVTACSALLPRTDLDKATDPKWCKWRKAHQGRANIWDCLGHAKRLEHLFPDWSKLFKDEKAPGPAPSNPFVPKPLLHFLWESNCFQKTERCVDFGLMEADIPGPGTNIIFCLVRSGWQCHIDRAIQNRKILRGEENLSLSANPNMDCSVMMSRQFQTLATPPVNAGLTATKYIIGIMHHVRNSNFVHAQCGFGLNNN